MGKVEQRLVALGLVLPEPLKPPAGVVLPFEFVRVSGSKAFVSGHGPTNADGSLAGPLGKVGQCSAFVNATSRPCRPDSIQTVSGKRGAVQDRRGLVPQPRGVPLRRWRCSRG